MSLFATEYIRRIRGGSTQPFLMRCSDGNYYVVKLQNNPQGKRVLANDLFGALLAKRLGLPAAESVVIDVSDALIKLTDEMIFISADKAVACQPGPSFGSRYATGDPFGEIIGAEFANTFLPRDRMMKVKNLSDFIGMLVFDRWTSNTDTRQVVFVRNCETGSWNASMIDHGWCFGGAEWSFPDKLHAGACYSGAAYESIAGIEDFEPWLNRVEHEIDKTDLEQLARQVPKEWYDGDVTAMCELVATLDHRRGMVRKLLQTTWEDYPRLFPSWVDRTRRPIAIATHA